MDEFEHLQTAIHELGDELPGLVGEDWPGFKAELDGYLAQGENDMAQIARALILALFARYPDAHARLVARLAEKGVTKQYQHQPVAMSQAESATAAKSAMESATEPAMVTRYTDILCPRRVWIETPRIAVVVRLTLEPTPESAASEDLSLRADLPVQVQIEAPHFECLNEERQKITVLPDRDSAPIVFDLRPLRVGPTQITLDFWQNGQPLRAVTMEIEISAQEVGEGADSRPVQPIRMEPDATPPDRVLHIAWDAEDASLHFSLIQQGGAWWRTFAPVKLSGDPAHHAAQLYRRIAPLVDGDDPTAAAVLGARNWIAPEDVDRRLKKMGQHLWETLIPPDLQRLYAGERERWADASLLVFSDEPHLPWELIWPYDVDEGGWEDEGPWCHSLRMTRWLRKDEHGNGSEMAPSRLHQQATAVIAPTYSLLDDLPSARIEEETLLELMEERGVRPVGPGEPTWGNVMDFLEEGGYDWVHFAAHGNFYPQAPDGDSALWLQEDSALTPQDLAGAAITRRIRQRRPGFFFNACEVGRQGWSLTRLGGWASRLVSLGAGVFVGPLWAVSDDGARLFAETFYRALLDGETAASATRQARLAARESGDPTWLAYSVYAHPNARVRDV